MDIKSFREYLLSLDYSITTVDQYIRDISHLYQWYIDIYSQHLTIEKVNLSSLKKYRIFLFNKGLNVRTIEKKMRSVRKFLIWAKSTGHLNEKKLKNEEDVIHLDINETRVNNFISVVNKVGSNRDKAIICLIMNTGLKPEMIINLKIKDLSISEKTLCCADNKIILDEEVLIILKKYVTEQKEFHKDYLFSNKFGEKVNYKVILYTIKKYAKLSGNLEINIKVLRKYCAKMMLRKGVDLGTVIKILQTIPNY